MFFLHRGTPQALTEFIFILDKTLTVWLIWYPLLQDKPVHCKVLPLKTALPHRDGPSSHFYTMWPWPYRLNNSRNLTPTGSVSLSSGTVALGERQPFVLYKWLGTESSNLGLRQSHVHGEPSKWNLQKRKMTQMGKGTQRRERLRKWPLGFLLSFCFWICPFGSPSPIRYPYNLIINVHFSISG